MAEVIYKNHLSCFLDLLGSTQKSAVFVSPFLKKDMAEEISRYLNENIDLRVLTRLDNESMRQKAQDPEALKVFKQNFSNLEIKVLDDLHAKIYLFDNNKALVTSANLTVPAFNSNIEYGVLLDKPEEIEPVIENVNELYSKATRFEDYESKILSAVNKTEARGVRNREVLSDAIKSINNASFSPSKRAAVSKTKTNYMNEEESETVSIIIGNTQKNNIVEVYREYETYEWMGEKWARFRSVKIPGKTYSMLLERVEPSIRDAEINKQWTREYEEESLGRPPPETSKTDQHSLNEIEPIHFNGPRTYKYHKIRQLKLGEIIQLDSKNDYDSKNYVEFNLSGAHKIISSKAYKWDKKQILIIEETIDNTETKFTRKSEPLKVHDYIDNCWSKVEDGVCNWITASPSYLGWKEVSNPDGPGINAYFKYNSGTTMAFVISEYGGPDTWVRLRSIETDRDITLSRDQLIKFIS